MWELTRLIMATPAEDVLEFSRRLEIIILRVAPCLAIAVWMLSCAGSCGWAAGWYLVEALP